MFQSLSYCYASLIVLAVILVFKRPSKPDLTLSEVNETGSTQFSDRATTEASTEGPTLKQCLMHQQFWIIYLMSFCSIMFGIATLDVYKTYAISNPKLDFENYITIISAVNSFFSALRFIWSWALDHYSYKVVYGTLLVIQIILACTFGLAGQTKYLYALWVWLALWCEAGHFVLVPNILNKIYGN